MSCCLNEGGGCILSPGSKSPSHFFVNQQLLLSASQLHIVQILISSTVFAIYVTLFFVFNFIQTLSLISSKHGNILLFRIKHIIQGVPQLSSHFVLLVFSASHAHTEVHFTIFQQPRRRRFQNSPYFPPYIKNWSSYRAKREANWI